MQFDDDAQLDTSQVSDRRGRGGPLMLGGGGLVGVLGLVIALLTGSLGGEGTSPLSDPLAPSGGAGAGDLAAECRTGADANRREDCRIVAVVNSVQKYWTGEIRGYRPSRTVFFSQVVNSSCGQATSDTGPFYCPTDETVYLDLTFFEDLRTRFGAKGGPFAEAYVIAHEYGHHIQGVTGLLARGRSNAAGSEGGSVRTELMADCLAGMWAQGATETGVITQITEADIQDGLDAAATIGDDRLQRRSGSAVNPDLWTHGSSEQRQRWFLTGYRAATANECNTFAGSRI